MAESFQWLLLIESVTSHGSVDSKRHEELSQLFAAVEDKLVFVSAFPDHKSMAKYRVDISWETEVWFADSPPIWSTSTASASWART